MSGRRPVRVAVIGGGVSGMSVAHELTKGALGKDFSVTVFERRDHLGGKASSSRGRHRLPAEHGFRFFPGFYAHLTETMREIINPGDGRCVASHLVELDTAVMADSNGALLTVPLKTSTPRKLGWKRLKGVWSFRASRPKLWESLCFLGILARLATTCEERWEGQLEYQSWLGLATSPERARQRSENYRRLFVIGLTRSFVATRAEEMSAQTGGKILLQLLYDSWFGPPITHAADRALDGPTTDVWLQPWTDQLKANGVQLATGWTVTGLVLDELRVTDLNLERHDLGAGLPIKQMASHLYPKGFDYYVLAVPCEVLKKILVNSPTLRAADPCLARVFNLRTKWMNGIVLGLTEELHPQLPKGHVLCLGSEWALTLVDQTRFWQESHLKDVPFKTVLSVDISDWDSPGICGLPAKEIGPDGQREALVAEIWEQLRQHLPQLREVPPPQKFNLDLDIQYPHPGAAMGLDKIAVKAHNDEPLLINTPGSWDNRPDAATKAVNLFVAGDFARTFTNFASMEAANEAAKRAVNALLEREGFVTRCTVTPLQDPDVDWFAVPQRWGRRVDAVLYKHRLPFKPPFRLPMLAWLVLGLGSRPTGGARRSTG